MKIISFVQDGHLMVPVEVEISISTGLPKVFFTSMVDNAVKESITRIKMAFKAQNFQWPNKNQITINLRPAYIKKCSQGLDLAIAYAILLKTKQLFPISREQDVCYVYGEVTLGGQVEAPNDCFQIDEGPLLTGVFKTQQTQLKSFFSVKNLSDLQEPHWIPALPISDFIKKPKLPSVEFSRSAAELLIITAAGEHSMLLAGTPGSGKTTMAHNLQFLLRPPSEKEFEVTQRISHFFSQAPCYWRPFVSPHHSTPPLSMIGGGYPPFMGEISKAHGGLLFLDEYLEFQQKVQEALREPMERGDIFISRRGQCVRFPARFLLIAATNLCPCGSLVPDQDTTCSYSIRRCRSYLDRLSGPMLDRFDILALSSSWKGKKEVSMADISDQIERAYQFRLDRDQLKPNSMLLLDELEKQIDPFILKNLLPSHISSYRRRIALLRVSRTLADLEQKKQIEQKDIERANLFTIRSFDQLKQIH